MTIVIYYVDIVDKGKIMVSRIAFRNDVNKYWTDIIEYVEAYTGLTGTGQDPSIAQANILRVVPKFGEVVRLVYNPIAASDVTTGLQGLVSGLFEAVALIENQIPTDALTARVAGNVIVNLASTLETLNPDWSKPVITEIFTNIWTGWLNHANAKLTNDMPKMMEAYKLSSDNAMSFAQAFITGVEKQYNPIFF